MQSLQQSLQFWTRLSLTFVPLFKSLSQPFKSSLSQLSQPDWHAVTEQVLFSPRQPAAATWDAACGATKSWPLQSTQGPRQPWTASAGTQVGFPATLQIFESPPHWSATTSPSLPQFSATRAPN